MAEYKIERKKLSVEIYGTEYAISKPKFKQVIDMQEKLQALPAEEKFKYISKFLADTGIPEDVLGDMDADSVIELLEVINGSKKN